MSPVAASAGILTPVMHALAADQAGDTKGPKPCALRTHPSLGPALLIEELCEVRSNRPGDMRQNTPFCH